MLSAISPATEKTFKGLVVKDWNDDDEDKEIEETEPLLIANTKRFVLFPIKYSAIWNHYKVYSNLNQGL